MMGFLSFNLILTAMVVTTLTSCGITRPNIQIGNVNAPKKQFRSYNMRDDYDDEGNRKPGAKPKIYSLHDLDDMNKWMCITSDEGPEEAQARLLAYLRKLRDTPPKCPTN